MRDRAMTDTQSLLVGKSILSALGAGTPMSRVSLHITAQQDVGSYLSPGFFRSLLADLVEKDLVVISHRGIVGGIVFYKLGTAEASPKRLDLLEIGVENVKK